MSVDESDYIMLKDVFESYGRRVLCVQFPLWEDKSLFTPQMEALILLAVSQPYGPSSLVSRFGQNPSQALGTFKLEGSAHFVAVKMSPSAVNMGSKNGYYCYDYS